ncbi:MAG: flagellar biosynthesis anti-sigma factor FlgM [Defluviitaleaceae bacterium]|nr:flagellar biosynthesis anti-sigma factor FlgM [Defluviitaleaceae bacterium]
MRIGNITNIYETYAIQQSNTRVNRGGNNSGDSRRDSLDVSPSARSFTAALQAISNAPDIREERVSVIRSQIESGTYPLDASRIADSILG